MPALILSALYTVGGETFEFIAGETLFDTPDDGRGECPDGLASAASFPMNLHDCEVARA